MILTEREQYEFRRSLIEIEKNFAKLKAKVLMACSPILIYDKDKKDFIKTEYPEIVKEQLKRLSDLECDAIKHLAEVWGIEIKEEVETK